MRMVFVPGFSQTAASWSGVLAHLPLRTDATVVEIPAAETFEATADALADQGGPALWVGYSMGGRLALSVALRHPDRVAGLLLVSATAGISDPAEREARVRRDAELAADAERLGTDAFLDQWMDQPMFATVPKNAVGLSDRRTLSPAHLAHQLRALGPGVMPDYWDALTALPMPVLIVTGTLDTKFTAIGDDMAARIPQARHEEIACGHAIPLEAPTALADIVTTFLHDVTA